MQPTSSPLAMSFGKKPRPGQLKVIEEVLAMERGDLTCQLPTGYGKTFTALASYAGLRRANVVDRLLYIVPRASQLNQFLDDAKDNFLDAGVNGTHRIYDVGYGPIAAIKAHRKNSSHVFACTIQALATSGRTWEGVQSMLESGRWMVVVDEYHHYGNEATWGQKAASLPCVFRLAMSATPFRMDHDSAFGEPDIRVRYREALEEHAVKKLLCHSYVYRLDVEMPDKTIKSYTTGDIIQEAGSAEPGAIDKMYMDRAMRWLPQYVSPLVEIPINRALNGRLKSGVPQQVLIKAMCCSHAQLVCEQVCAMFPDLRVDWVGTGDYGRPDKENREILAKFCPPKRDGRRDPDDIKLDVLVNVGMAGEGLDAIYVTEVIHLTSANINNSNNQGGGRASRVIPGLANELQVAYINVDSCSEYAKYPGEAVMDLMDDLKTPRPKNPTLPIDVDGGEDDPDGTDIPIDPLDQTLRIVDMECIRIDEGDLQRFKIAYARVIVQQAAALAGKPEDIATPEAMHKLMDDQILNNPTSPLHAVAEQLYRNMKAREAEQFNAKSQNRQLREFVNSARRTVTQVCLKRLGKNDGRKDSELAGSVIKALNSRAKQLYGPCSEDAGDSLLLSHQRFYHDLKEDIIGNGIPNWLRADIEYFQGRPRW